MQDKTRQPAWGMPQSFGLGQFGKAAQMLHTAEAAAAGEKGTLARGNWSKEGS